MTIDLRPIRSIGELDRAIATIDALADRRDEWGADEHDDFLALALLIERYEDEIYGGDSGTDRVRDDHPLAME
jgi:antitoxin component HigA of HigAB toxin-antitoxin module